MKLGNGLQIRITLGYIAMLIVGIGMAFILVHERNRIREIKTESAEIQQVRHDINAVHQCIMELAILGESVIGWEGTDSARYHTLRLRTDSLLQALKPHCTAYVHPAQIDTLRFMLADKEEHLLRIMEAMEQQNQADSLLVNHLPEVARQATHIRTVRRKKDNFWGKLGAKETVQVLPSAKELHELSDSLTVLLQQQAAEMDAYADSLSTRNRTLNAELGQLIRDLDKQTQEAFAGQERKISEAQALSVRLFTITISVAIVLLFLSYLAIHRDIRLKAAGQERMRHLLDEYNELLGMYKKTLLTVSHDIRGPLNVINNYVKWAISAKDEAVRNAYLRNVRHSYSHILQLVNNLLDVYRLNEAKDTRNDIPFRLSALLERIAVEYTLSANDKGLLFSKQFDHTDVTVKGDADRLEQIIDNLLSNAVKFTKHGSVTFTAQYGNGRLGIRVMDTGIGMDKDTQERIFTPFEQCAPEMNAGGFGLGLSIVDGTVRLLGGEITVESRPGKGSVFSVSLPMPLTTEETEYGMQPETGLKELPKFVLAIEDDPLQLELCKEMLERNGVRCTACIGIEQLVDKMRRHDYDLLLTDMQMPGTDGFALLKLLRESDIGNSRTIPVIAMTARGEYDTEHLEEKGFAGCVYKPYSWTELRNALCNACRTPIPPAREKFDFSPITGEVRDKARMLEMFITEAGENADKLEDALKRKDRELLRRTVHRMQPLWEMLRIDKELEELWETLRDGNADSSKVEGLGSRILGLCRKLIREAELELEKEHGKDTDC